MAVLLQTLRAASEPPTFTFQSTVSGGATSTTVAGLKDGSDATFSQGEFLDDLGAGGGGNAQWSETWALDIASTVGTIEFVRVKIRARQNAIAGTGSTSWRPRAATSNGGSLQGVSGPFAVYQQDMASDPADSQPWTLAKINAKKFGWFANIVGGDLSQIDCDVSELTVELWGSEPSDGGMVWTLEVVRRKSAAFRFRSGLARSAGVDPATIEISPPGGVRQPLSEFVKFELGWRLGIKQWRRKFP